MDGSDSPNAFRAQRKLDVHHSVSVSRVMVAVIALLPLIACSTSNLTRPREKQDLVSLGFVVLVNGEYDQMKDLVMNLDRYKQVPGFDEVFRDKGPDAKKRFIEERSFERQRENFQLIRKILSELGFDFGKAKVVRVQVKQPRDEKDLGTKWIEYDPSDTRQRLDIVYLVESDGNYAQIKLNDTFVINGRRYLGSGFYFSTYLPRQDADESVWKTVIRHHLNGYMPSFIELVNQLEAERQ